MTTKLAVAALATLALALQAGILHAAVAAPLGAAVAGFRDGAPVATFEETIVVRAPARPRVATVPAPTAVVGG